MATELGDLFDRWEAFRRDNNGLDRHRLGEVERVTHIIDLALEKDGLHMEVK